MAHSFFYRLRLLSFGGGRAHLCSLNQWGSTATQIDIETNLKSRRYYGGGKRKWRRVYFRKFGFEKVDWHGLFHSQHFWFWLSILDLALLLTRGEGAVGHTPAQSRRAISQKPQPKQGLQLIVEGKHFWFWLSILDLALSAF
jgi:hypothetical protein